MMDMFLIDGKDVVMKLVEFVCKFVVCVVVWVGLLLVWLVLIIVLIVMFGVGWNVIVSWGMLILVKFKDVIGIIFGEIVVKFCEIIVGKVEFVCFISNFQQVEVNICVDKDVV